MEACAPREGGSLMVKQIKADHELLVAYNDKPEGSAG